VSSAIVAEAGAQRILDHEQIAELLGRRLQSFPKLERIDLACFLDRLTYELMRHPGRRRDGVRAPVGAETRVGDPAAGDSNREFYPHTALGSTRGALADPGARQAAGEPRPFEVV